MNGRHLFLLDFELAYLALLSRYNIKRLSRWEGKLSPSRISILRDLGLEVVEVRRKLLFGRKTYETVFSNHKRWTDFYRSAFEMTRIKETPEEVHRKGFLFGYPSCCVEAFIRKPYTRNGLLPKDQEILFHWACPDCNVTPGLLKEYRSIHGECVRLFGGQVLARKQPRYRRERPSPISLQHALGRHGVPVAAGLSALLLLPFGGCSTDPGTCGPGSEPPDQHMLPVGDDIDDDYLSFEEEILSGHSTNGSDTYGDGVLDGVSYAAFLSGLIEGLPREEQDDRPYRIDMPVFGLETCEVCGECINMGAVQIVNPLRDLDVEVPYICLHYLEHGGLGYAGDVHTGRLALARLKRVLLAADESHAIGSGWCQGEDADQDGLCDLEESFLGTDPEAPDSDGDSVKDGPQIVEHLLEMVAALPREERVDEPYLIENLFRGLETCEICGAIFNMGYATIVNPVHKLSIDVPFVALHALAHGSLVYDGTENTGRVLPTALREVLKGIGTPHWLAIEDDGDSDGLKDLEEAHFLLDPQVQDTDGDGIPDGRELANAMAATIEALPTGPLPNEIYVIHNMADGIYQCLVCGEWIDMGFIEIVNPNTDESVDVPYYTLHFMKYGSFATDRPSLYPRIDPRDIDHVWDKCMHIPGSELKNCTRAIFEL
jgi:hypothetical protein